MGFCTQCGNQVEETAKFCGKCGAEIKRERNARQVDPPVEKTFEPSSAQSNALPQFKKKDNKNWKIAGIVAIVLAVCIYFMVTPKHLSEQEYEDLVIKLLVADMIAQEGFGEKIEYSGVDVGLDPDWSEEYRQFIGPAKKLEKDFAKLRKALEDVEPPGYFAYEHETLLKVFSAHENMAVNIGIYMETGKDEYVEYSEEYESRADQYIEESIFATDEYEDRLFQAYQSSMME